MRKQIGLKRSLRIFGLSVHQYKEWELRCRFNCFDSFKSLCAKRHPYQLSMKEIRRMQQLLTDPETDHWPIASIAANGLRNRKMIASLYSWYKYARLLGITKKAVRKHRKTEGLIATKANEYLHIDTTHYQLNEDNKVFITFVMDNYSKMILGFSISEKLNYMLVKGAFEHAIDIISLHPDAEKPEAEWMITLIADGGSENHHQDFNDWLLKLSNFKIKKIKALKEIRFSNSPVEAIHRTIKGRYLRNKAFNSIDALEKHLNWAVKDYNILRPHYKHRPRTPYEVYFDLPLNFNVRKRMKEAMEARIMENRCTNCTQCKGICERNEDD